MVFRSAANFFYFDLIIIILDEWINFHIISAPHTLECLTILYKYRNAPF